MDADAFEAEREMPTLLRIAGMAAEKRKRKVSQIDAQLGKKRGRTGELTEGFPHGKRHPCTVWIRNVVDSCSRA